MANVNRRANCDCNKACDNAISADVRRVYDSCADRDCLEGLEVVFPAEDATVLETACSVKATDCSILTCYVNVDEVSYNRGCYSVECNYYFVVDVEVYPTDGGAVETISGVCTFTKRSMLYGATGDIYTFTSADSAELPTSATEPVAKVQAMEPMLLGSQIVPNTYPTCVPIPEAVNTAQGGTLAQNTGERKIVVTLGLFSIIQLGRDVQVTLPSYEFAVPEKECNIDNASPCDVFRSFDFPLEEFFPEGGANCNRCGCDKEMDYCGECPVNAPSGQNRNL